MMIFRILGPMVISVPGGGDISPQTREARILGVLLLQCNRSVSFSALVDLLYGARPPVTARQQVQNCASRLGRLVHRWTGVGAFRRVASGYRLDLADDQIDALAFERMLGRAHAADSQGDRRTAATAYRSALALWRGDVLGDAAVGDFSPSKARLAELRRMAVEEWLEAEFVAAGPAAVLSEVTASVGEYPLNERLVGLRMRALAALGRTTEALHVFRETRARLVEEHGIEPGEGLAAIHAAILRGRAGTEDPLFIINSRPHIDGPADPAAALKAALVMLDRVRIEVRRTLRSLESSPKPRETSA